jgi:hypothetical protein
MELQTHTALLKISTFSAMNSEEQNKIFWNICVWSFSTNPLAFIQSYNINMPTAILLWPSHLRNFSYFCHLSCSSSRFKNLSRVLEFFSSPPCSDRLWGPPSLLFNGY